MHRRTQRSLLLLALAVLAAGGTPAGALTARTAPAARAAAPTFVLTGHGFGHGVGMAQYGTLGYAQGGQTAAQILAHYYPGTTLGPTTATQVRVLLQQDAARVSARSAGGLVVRDEGGTGVVHVPAATAAVVKHTATGFTVTGGTPAASGWTGPVSIAPAGATPVQLDGLALNATTGRTYRGRIRVVATAKGEDAVNVVALEEYLRGVVPSEMPSGWPAAALQTQAIASRSYALATAKGAASPFDVYPDQRSQVYGGISAERPTADAAVTATAKRVVLYGGRVAVTYFSSSSGGKTAAVQESFPNAAPVPYLVSVDDPYDTLSPNHNWTATLQAADVASALHYTGTITGLTLSAYPSGRVKSVTLDGSAGAVSVAAGTFRSALGLRSTWFSQSTGPSVPVTPGGLRLARPVRQGDRVNLTGTAPAGVVTLQAGQGQGWRNVATHLVLVTGATTFRRHLGEAVRYRLTATVGNSNTVQVTVGTSLVLHRRPVGLAGRLYPARAGEHILLQVVRGGHWQTVAVVRTHAGGIFRFRVSPRGRVQALFTGHGVYRRAVGVLAPRRLAWVPTDPLGSSQWDMAAIHAWDYWPSPPTFPRRVTVAVVDGGIDPHNPEFIRPDGTSVIKNERSFADGAPQWAMDHGTAVAGIIAAQADNGHGIAGVDPWGADLLDVRIVGPGGVIDPVAEARGIRWAVSQHAQVINLSLGGRTRSAVEAAAVRYAYAQGAVIVAATGNSLRPWYHASYPAALPHVLGVSAVDANLHTPDFSNRDRLYNDIAAPGVGLTSTVSLRTAASGLSRDAPPGPIVDQDHALDGTSFATPHVSGAAALLLGLTPLQPDQVMAILEDTAHPLTTSSSGSTASSATAARVRDPAWGFGLLDVAAAVREAVSQPFAVPAPDTLEPDDTVKSARPLGGRVIQASVDSGDDPVDIYKVQLRKGAVLTTDLSADDAGLPNARLTVWSPGVQTVSRPLSSRFVAARSQAGTHDTLTVVATRAGTYLIEVQAVRGGGSYHLRTNFSQSGTGSSSSSPGTSRR
jgi:stage II sporulation protein D